MTDPKTEGLTTYDVIEIFCKLITDLSYRTALMLWGLTGIGKSELVRQVLRNLSLRKETWNPKNGITTTGALEVFGDWGLLDFRLSQLEPTDLRGLPDLNGKTVLWLPPEELPFVGQEARFPAKGVVFLDELTQAQPMMQSACFSLVLDRRIGPHVLLDGWKIIAASNYSEENASTYQMSDPLRSRFDHYNLRPDLNAFKKWGFANGIDARILAFLNWNPDYLHKRTDTPEQAFASPRNWARASQMLQMFKDGHLEKVIAATVGQGAGSMFYGFLEVFSKPELTVDIRAILRKKAKAPELSTENPGIAWAFAACVAGHVKDDPTLLPLAIEFFCSDAWKKALEIGRTGLADLKHVVGNEIFAEALQPLMPEVQKQYGQML